MRTQTYTFTTEPKMTAEIAASIMAEYVRAQGDEDKAGDPNDGAYHEGQKEAFLAVLAMIHGQAPRQEDGTLAPGWVDASSTQGEVL